ncbi:MAG: hypothetical protein J3K34DRAFT_146910 [Monoraphidium minutum]|nr:MAG: hypothetical protein J3K34DRAFT_146910 [Monoraphidium minutum]
MEAMQEDAHAGEQVAEEAGGPMTIDVLQSHGIPAADIKKLREGGIHTVEALAHAPKKELTMIKGISEAKVEKLQREAWKIVPMGFTTASIVAEQRGEIIQITTGCKELDNILDGARRAGARVRLGKGA